MRKIFRRSITGLLYVALLLSAVFVSPDAFDFLFMAFGLACLYEFSLLVKLKRYYIFLGYLLLWWIFIYFINNIVANVVLLAVTVTVNILLLFYLFSDKKELNNIQKYIVALSYIGVGCIFITLIPYSGETFSKPLIISIFVLIWVNDTFAFLVGKMLGKNRCVKKISPKKTVEGYVGGLTFVLIAAYIISKYVPELSLLEWMILAVVTFITGNLGDLLESKFKRVAEVKDSGAILPGHGGILDRLDSLVFAAPFIYLVLIVFKYVS